MRVSDIRKMPTVTSKSHESVLRAYHILEKVKDYLKRGVPVDVMLELIEEMESNEAD